MEKNKLIPTSIKSGSKYTNKHGATAIKDGIKQQKSAAKKLTKPDWLKIRLQSSDKYLQIKKLVADNSLNTVCEEAKCPNIDECWSHGTATFMLMGAICTRACKFCAVDTGNPHGWLDKDEPRKVTESALSMQLKYIVLTSVNRDDLADGGAQHFANTIMALKTANLEFKVEALTPDFKGNTHSVDTILSSGVDVFAQNIETVKRLTHPVRDNRAGYQQTLDVLQYAKTTNPNIITKTSIILGLGETEQEIIDTMDDLIAHKVEVLTLGQYLQPTPNHWPIDRFVHPDEFAKYQEIALAKGFIEVASGPMVRSSYRADKLFYKE